MNRVLAIDFGAKRIGLALSDPLKIIASPFEVWENKGQDNFFEKLKDLIRTKNIGTIVIGLPKNMDGTVGFQAEEVKTFFEDFINNEKEIKFVYWDERLSSKEAETILQAQGIKAEDQKGIKDAYAASVFLKEYLEYGV